jgi:glycosyltransferase involved in cell wall biosynthesis
MNFAFAWAGLPDYAARCLRAVRARGLGELQVLGTRSVTPIRGMEDSLGAPIIWIEGAREGLRWADLDLPAPDVFFQGGYGTPAFRALGRDCRAHGGKVVCLSDVNWIGGFRQNWIDPLRHRFGLGRGFDGFFVAGDSGLRWARRAGYRRKPLRAGMLGADPALFTPGPPLATRAKRFLFVGRNDPIKNIERLLAAFEAFTREDEEWRLDLIGPEGLSTAAPPRASVRPFSSPDQVASALRDSRCLVLPSFRDRWGLVVHEAALSGCALALAPRVGAALDLASSDNAVIFDGWGRGDILHGLRRIARWSDAQWARAEAESLRRAGRFGPQVFADSVAGFLRDFEAHAR